MRFILKRAYDAASPQDGYRVLVDRLWPRGIKKQDLPYDEWPKVLCPSPKLRQWFGHDPKRWQTFAHAYELELEGQRAEVESFLLRCHKHKRVSLVYAAKDPHHNHARVLKMHLEKIIH